MKNILDLPPSKELALGIELGSTRIKSVLIGPNKEPLATGSHEWENQYVDGVWTYSLDAVWQGLRESYADLKSEVQAKYGTGLTEIGSIGISAMMHGYLPFDAAGELLTPFRTWRNTFTEEASAELSELFAFNIPQRWSISHLYQAIRNGEEHVDSIRSLTTLAGYVHWQLTGEQKMGVGEASGMFPIDSTTGKFHAKMLDQFTELIAKNNFSWNIAEILPEVQVAGEQAGNLTAAGANLLDPSGDLQPGAIFCPPEGDAGTGMVATDAVAPRTGNISVGTSIFGMVVLEHELKKRHDELDIVTTPAGDQVAMVHCNNGASEIGAWAQIFREFGQRLSGADVDSSSVFQSLFTSALESEGDAGGLIAYNYLSGEHITGFEEGRPLVVRRPGREFTLGNFVRSQLYAAFATLRLGMDILTQDEGVEVDKLLAHGGMFQTEGVAQQLLAGSLNVPVSISNTASEGGAWGVAVLAAYAASGKREAGQNLQEYLDAEVFANTTFTSADPQERDVAGFNEFYADWRAGFAVERAAIENL